MRASSLSNTRVVDLLNHYFISVTVDGVYYQHNDAVAKEERSAYRQVFQDLHLLNKKNKEDGKPLLSIGSVHAYVLNSAGKPLDSLHVASAGPKQMIAMLEKQIAALKVAKGKPVVKPARLSVAPKANADELVFHLTARYLVSKDQPNARKDIDGTFVPLKPVLGAERSGQWSALPSEDWLVLKPAQWRKLLPAKPVTVGASWNLDRETASQMLTRFYPTTENNDLSTNRIDEQTLKGTVNSIKDGVVRARLEGTLKMKHAFYPRKEDKNMVEATLLGYVEFQQDRTRIRALRLVTDTATYGGARQHFGAALRLVSGRAE
jgi:hypothetical protein